MIYDYRKKRFNAILVRSMKLSLLEAVAFSCRRHSVEHLQYHHYACGQDTDWPWKASARAVFGGVNYCSLDDPQCAKQPIGHFTRGSQCPLFPGRSDSASQWQVVTGCQSPTGLLLKTVCLDDNARLEQLLADQARNSRKKDLFVNASCYRSWARWLARLFLCRKKVERHSKPGVVLSSDALL